jgi:hypothetical protein
MKLGKMDKPILEKGGKIKHSRGYDIPDNAHDEATDWPDWEWERRGLHSWQAGDDIFKKAEAISDFATGLLAGCPDGSTSESLARSDGKLSPKTVAAEFLELKGKLSGPAAVDDAAVFQCDIFKFCEAWRMLHMEYSDAHKTAMVGLTSIDARKKGAKGNQAKGERRETIIEQAVRSLCGTVTDQTKIKAPFVTPRIKGRVKAACDVENLVPLSDEKLNRKVREILKRLRND